MSKLDQQLKRQGGRCHWCQAIMPSGVVTRDHLHPRRNGQRARLGNDYVLACHECNQARGALTIGSLRFTKWLRRVMRGEIRPFIRRETFVHNPT